MTFTNVFGNNTLPPSEYGYAAFSLTSNSTFVWPYNSSNAAFTIAKVMDVACSAGVVVTLPDARQVSTGEDFLIRNLGAETLTVNDASGAQVAQVLAGAASYFYLTDNSTEPGAFGVIAYGVGTSFVDAASLIGYGIKAVGASLNQSHPTFPVNSAITISDDHRSKLVIFTGGAETFPLTSASTLGDDYFFLFRNEGTGTATLDPASAETIDGQATMQVQPGESLILICTGSEWFSVGYGRSVLYQFTQLTKDVSAGGTITLTAAEASNKLLTFIGNPSGAVEVVVPAVVAVYYTQSAISTAQTIILKTSAGSGVGIDQGTRVISLCDGTNVVSAQSAVANASVSLTDGSALAPSLFFATQTNTGLFKSGTRDVGVTVNGSVVGVFGSTGLQTTTIGPNSSQRHTVPAVSSDTIALLAATQTLTNKTLTTPVLSSTASGTVAGRLGYSSGAVSYGTGSAQKTLAATDDSRFTDAREWTAATVDQAEAEAGTATTRRAWTAQRVRQAIAAWWLTASSAFGRTLANVADAAAGRTALGLGTAATATVTTSSTDTTAGRVTKVGDFGWGGVPEALTGSWNNLGGASRLVAGDLSTTADGPFSGPFWLFGNYVQLGPGNGYFYGVTLNNTNPRVFLRILSTGVWQPWVEMPRTGFDAQFAALTASAVNTPAIKFPATQVASSDPNTLDDYEEGSFTPVAKGQSSAGVGTYTIQLGKYTKVGRVVFFQILITWTAHTGTGNLQITGLPFITASDPYSYSYFTVAPSDLTYSGQMAANAQPGTDIVSILSLSSNSPITPVGMDVSAGLRITGHYLV